MKKNPDLAPPGEVQEQYFFMASWEFLRDKGKPELRTCSSAPLPRNCATKNGESNIPKPPRSSKKWPQLADAALAANRAGQTDTVEATVAEFRKL